MNAKSAVLRVRERIHDRDARAFDDDEILRAFDDAVSDIFTVIRTHGEMHGLDYIDIAIGSLTKLSNDLYQLDVPEGFADVQLVESITANTVGYQLVKAPLELKDQGRGVFPGSRAVWHWGPKGSIQIRGRIDGSQTIRLWALRAIPPLFYGIASGASSEGQLYMVMEDGLFKGGDDLYTGQQFECTQGTNLGFIRRCTAHVAELLTVSPLFSYPTANEQFAMVLPVPPEHHNYLVALVTHEMMTRQGSDKEREAWERKLMRLQAGFESGISYRSSGEPTRFFSSRTTR